MTASQWQPLLTGRNTGYFCQLCVASSVGMEEASVCSGIENGIDKLRMGGISILLALYRHVNVSRFTSVQGEIY